MDHDANATVRTQREAAPEGDKGCCERSGDTLPDGTPVSLCLWAVGIDLPHPITRDPLCLQLPEPDIFHSIRTAFGLSVLDHPEQPRSQDIS